MDEVKLSSYADDVMLQIENPKDSTQKLLKLINKFIKVAGYKTNIQNSVALLYTNDEISERQKKKKIPFKILSKKKKKKKHLGRNLTKEVKDIYAENYETLIKEIENDSKKCKDIPHSRTGRINIVKMAIPPKIIYKFNVIPIKLSHDIFHRTRTNNLKIYMEEQKTQNCQSNPEEKEQKWRHNPLGLQTILHNYRIQNSVVLAQKQAYGPMEQN